MFVAPLGLMVGVAYYLIFARRERLRQKLLAAPFRMTFRDVLRQRVPLYAADRRRKASLRRRSCGVLGSSGSMRSVGWEDGDDAAQVKLTDEHRVLIAASAAILASGTTGLAAADGSRHRGLSDRVCRGDVLDGTERARDWHGPRKVRILFAIAAIEQELSSSSELAARKWAVPEPATQFAQSHVGLHEFAHVLDFLGQQGRSTGVPVLLPPSVQRESGIAACDRAGARRWTATRCSIVWAEERSRAVRGVRRELFKTRRGCAAITRSYTACCRTFFNQDPASRMVPMQSVVQLRPVVSLGNTPRYLVRGFR